MGVCICLLWFCDSRNSDFLTVVLHFNIISHIAAFLLLVQQKKPLSLSVSSLFLVSQLILCSLLEIVTGFVIVLAAEGFGKILFLLKLCI